MDFGFHQSLSRAILMHVSGMDQRRRSLQQDIDQLHKSLAALDSREDEEKEGEGNTRQRAKFEVNKSCLTMQRSSLPGGHLCRYRYSLDPD